MINFYLQMSIPDGAWYEVQSSKQTHWHVIDLGRCQIHLLLKSQWWGTWQGECCCHLLCCCPALCCCAVSFMVEHVDGIWIPDVFGRLLSRVRVKSLLAQEHQTRIWNCNCKHFVALQINGWVCECKTTSFEKKRAIWVIKLKQWQLDHTSFDRLEWTKVKK